MLQFEKRNDLFRGSGKNQTHFKSSHCALSSFSGVQVHQLFHGYILTLFVKFHPFNI